MASKETSFRKWYDENKEGLKEPYKEYVCDMRLKNTRTDTKIIWAAERFNSING